VAMYGSAEGFDIHDADGDGKVDMEELRRAKIVESKADAEFAVLDKDGDGQVTRDEWVAVYGSAEGFDVYDADGDGKIDKGEFRRAKIDESKADVEGELDGELSALEQDLSCFSSPSMKSGTPSVQDLMAQVAQLKAENSKLKAENLQVKAELAQFKCAEGQPVQRSASPKRSNGTASVSPSPAANERSTSRSPKRNLPSRSPDRMDAAQEQRYNARLAKMGGETPTAQKKKADALEKAKRDDMLMQRMKKTEAQEMENTRQQEALARRREKYGK